MEPVIEEAKDLLYPPSVMASQGPIPTTVSKVGRGLAAGLLTALVLLGLFLIAVPIYLTLLRATLPKVVDVKEPLFFDYRLPEPGATMQLLPPQLQGKAYDYAAKDKPVKKFPRVFTPGQRYDVTVRLDLPDSEQNIAVGMFQVTVQLLSARGDVLATSTRPAMLHYRSPLVRLARLAAMAIPLVFNLFEEQQVLVLRMLNNYEEGPVPAIALRVLLQPSAGRPPALGLPQIYSAEAGVNTRLTGLVGLLYNWRFTSLVWGPFAIFMWELAIAVLCCPGLVLPGFLRTKSPSPMTPPIAPPVRAPSSPMEKDLLRTGGAAVGDLEDLEALDLDNIPRDELSTIEEESVIANGMDSESDYNKSRMVNGTSNGRKVDSGPQNRRLSVGSSGQRPKREYSHQDEGEASDLDGRWDENMEKALEDILEARLSPEASDAESELLTEEDDVSGVAGDVTGVRLDVILSEDDDDMPLLEDGKGKGVWDEGDGELESEDGVLAEEEAEILYTKGISKLNNLMDEKKGGLDGFGNAGSGLQNGSELGVGSGSKTSFQSQEKSPSGPAGSLRSTGDSSESAPSNLSKQATRQPEVNGNSLGSYTEQSQSLNNTKAPLSDGGSRPDSDTSLSVAAGVAGDQRKSVGGGDSATRSGASSGGDSPHTGVYSRFLSGGPAGSGSGGSLSEGIEKRSVNKSDKRGGEASSGEVGKESEEADFKDALETITPTVSNASMLDALETNDWAEQPHAERSEGRITGESEGRNEGREDKDGGHSSELEPLVGGLRRRGLKKEQDQ